MSRFLGRAVVAAGVLALAACAADQSPKGAAVSAPPADGAAIARYQDLADSVREAVRLFDNGQPTEARRLLADLVGIAPPPAARFMGTDAPLGIANSVTIGQLSESCDGGRGYGYRFCDGYLIALLEFRAAYDNAYRTRQSYCLPPSLTTRDVGKVFVEHTAAQPAWNGQPALWGVSRTLNDKFPC